MPTITPILYEVSDDTGQVLFADHHDNISDHAAIQCKLPRRMYTLRAPYIGTSKRELGNPLSRDQYFPELTTVLQDCIALGMESLSKDERLQKEALIIKSLKTYEIAYCVIHQLYSNLIRNTFPVPKFKEIFLFLEKNGALWHHIPFPEEQSVLERNRAVFKGLIKDVFGVARASEALGSVTVGDHPSTSLKDQTGFGYYKKEIDFFLELGTHLNGVSTEHPDQGTILHRYLAYESPFAVEFMDLLESKRILGKPNTHFNYAVQDGEGKTPLIIAIATRNVKAVYKLLAIRQKLGVDIGLNTQDQDGRTPLMLACAFGLPIVVQALLRQKANPGLQDVTHRIYRDYLNLKPSEQSKVHSMLVHPERGIHVNHSYVYANDGGKSPYCLYKEGEKPVSGDAQRAHFIVLSPLPQHQAQIQMVLDMLLEELKRATKQKQDKAKIEKIQSEIDFVKHQNQQAVSAGSKIFLAECLEGLPEVVKYLDSDAGRLAIEEARKHAASATSLDKTEKLAC